MQAEIPGNPQNGDLAQLRASVQTLVGSQAQLQAAVARQEALIATLLAERTTVAPAPAPRLGKRTKRTPDTVSAPSPASQPTSRRGLLKRLGTSAAGAAVAFGAGRATTAEATFDGTKLGESSNQYGIYASRNGDPRPAVGSLDAFGVLGTAGPGTLGPGNVPNAGVAGFSSTFIGVSGTSRDSVGVRGFSGEVAGVSGFSLAGHGVFGETDATPGQVVGGMLAAGLAGRTSSTIAMYGFTDGPPNPNYAPVGAVGQCQNGFGVWGLSSAGPGAASRPGGGTPTAISGVLGTSPSGLGVYAISSGSYALAADGNGPSTVGALLRGLGGGKAAVCVGDVEIQGHLTVTGGVNGPVSAAQADGSGTRQALPATVETVVAIGEGRLVGGRAEVRLEGAAVSAVPDEGYLVFLTEYDDHHALYVTSRTRQGFEVRAKDSPTASGMFSYRVVARARVAQAAGDRAPTPLHVPTIPVPQGVPTLPVGRETPPAAPKPDAR
jgi:hypothetical protein